MSERVLVLGVTGMLGSALVRLLDRAGLVVWGTGRASRGGERKNHLDGVDARAFDSVERAVAGSRPTVVVNCIGIVKQLAEAKDPIASIEVNALFPHRLARYCARNGIRLVHVSTDCVFSGKRGSYTEADEPDTTDLYGRTKLLGEVEGPGILTLRTSIIGHELGTGHGLVEWFLAQSGSVRGFRRAIYSGLPTCEVARVLAEYVLPGREIQGLYHVSSAPISKYELLRLIAREYAKQIDVIPEDGVVCDRSLLSDRFRRETGYVAPDWPSLVRAMHKDHMEYVRGNR